MIRREDVPGGACVLQDVREVEPVLSDGVLWARFVPHGEPYVAPSGSSARVIRRTA